MFEKVKRAAVLLAVGAAFCPGAWGQVTAAQKVLDKKTIAAEYFGAAEGRMVAARSATNLPTRVAILFRNATIQGGNEADLTFSLTGATFAGRVSLSQFNVPGDVSVKLVEGGQGGDSSVTVRIRVSPSQFVSLNREVYFVVPDLQVTPVILNPPDAPGDQKRGAAVDVSIEVVTRASGPFPDVIGSELNTDEDAEPVTIYELASVVDVAVSGEATEEVALTDRKVLVGGTDDEPAVLEIGAVRTTISATNVKPLMEAATTFGPDVTVANFPGDLVVTATGNFQTDDKVMLGEDMELTRNEDGGYSGSIAIEDAAAASDVKITYLPGGVDYLLPSTFTTTVAVQYDDELNASGPVDGQGTGTIEYQGLSLAAYAHGIIKPGGVATTYLRVVCASTTDCSVFASCKDQLGGSYFGELGVVAAGNLVVYNHNEIGEALNGGWDAGRGRCDLLSNGVLEVQNMLSQGKATSNNSAVTNAAGILTRTQ